jgi:hypothetical protein
MKTMAEISTLNGYKIKDKKAVRYYDTVSLMKTDPTLKDGMSVITKGYYRANDGGGAEYKVREITQDDIVNEGYLIALNNDQLVAELIIKNDVNIMTFYGLTKEITENNVNYRIWNDAFDEAFNTVNGKAKIIIPEGTFYLNETITLPYNATIEGVNQETSVLKLVPFSNCDMFHVGTIGSRDSGKLINLNLQGDFIQDNTNTHTTQSTTGNGIVFVQNSMDSDGITIQNCYIRNFAENGIVINSNVYVLLIENCQICFNRYNGIYNNGTDNFFNNLRVYFNGLSGIKSYLAGANKFSNIKLYYNCAIDNLTSENNEFNATLKSQNAGLIERACSRNEYNNIEVQDNYYTGISFYTTDGVLFKGSFDDNGFKGQSTQSLSDELYLAGCKNMNINGMFGRNDLGYVAHMIEAFNTTDSVIIYTRAMESQTGDPNVSGQLIYKNGTQTNLTVSPSFEKLCGTLYTKPVTLTFPAGSTRSTSQTVNLDFTPSGKTIAFVNLYTSYNVNAFANISGSSAYINAESYVAFSENDSTNLSGSLVIISM